MNKIEKKLTITLLRRAAEEFATHTCNDFDLDEVMPDVEDRRNFMKEFHEWNGDPESFDPKGTYEVVPNWLLMDIFANKLEQEL